MGPSYRQEDGVLRAAQIREDEGGYRDRAESEKKQPDDDCCASATISDWDQPKS